MRLESGYATPCARREQAVATGDDRETSAAEPPEVAALLSSPDSEPSYRDLFENTPVTLWVDDFSEAHSLVRDLVARGVSDLRAHFTAHQGDLLACLEGIKLLDVNTASLEAYEATSKQDLLGSLPSLLGPDALDRAIDTLEAIARGETSFEHEAVNLTTSGRPMDVLVRWRVMPGFEHDYSRVLVSTSDITERKATGTALRVSEERYRTLVEAAPIAIAVTAAKDGSILFANPAAVAQIGASSAAELLGRRAATILHPDTLHRARDRSRQVLRTHQVSGPSEERLVRLDGGVITVKVTSMYVEFEGQPAILGIFEDITARKEAEAAVEESKRRFRAIVESVPLGMHIYSLDGADRLVLIGTNLAADTILGFNHSVVLGKPIEEAFPGLVGTDLPSLYKGIALDGGPPMHWDVFQYSDGQIAGVFEVEAFQVESGSMAVMFSEISERRRMEKELEDHRAHLEQMVEERTAELLQLNRELEEATAAKDAFLASMSHELRTPLNSIIGFSGILAQGLAGPMNDEQQRQIGMVQRSGQVLLDLVNDVLDLATIEAGKVEIRPAGMSAVEVLCDLAEMMQPMAESKGLALECEPKMGAGDMISDRDRIEQILLNLLSNAIKFTSSGSVTLAVHEGEGDTVVFSVRDTGIGIPADDLDTIFEEFRQRPPVDSAKYPGTGLGLAIARRLARLLGGDVTVDSEIGVGSTFMLELPRIYAPD